MTTSKSDGQAASETQGSVVLSEILAHEWHRPVLRALSDGAKRYTQIKADVSRACDPAPGEGQINAALRELAQLGLVRKGVGKRDPWELTEPGTGAVTDLRMLEQLMTADPDQGAAAAVKNDPAARRDPTDLAKRAATFNPSVPHPARRYNYWLGGKDNFQADRDAGDEVERLYPGMRDGVRANRALLGRVVSGLAGEYGVRQFLDIGTGMPTADNVHEIAQAVAPACRVVYADNDRLVLVHARALLTSSPEGKTTYIEADVRNPDTILNSEAVRDTLDLSHPTALLLAGLLHFIPGRGAARPIVEHLMSQLAPGSFVFIAHGTNDFQPPEVIAAYEQRRREGRYDFWMRDKDEVTALFDGLQILSPGVVPPTKWRPEPGTPDLDLRVVNTWAGLARKT